MKIMRAFCLLIIVGVCGLLLSCKSGKESMPAFGAADLLLAASPKGMSITGMEGPEQSTEGVWRWMIGQQASLRFNLDKPQTLVLRYAMNNPLPGQRIELLVNKTSVSVHDGLEATPWLKRSVQETIRIDGKQGVNTVEWKFSLQNHSGVVFAENDKRPLAQVLLECRIYPANSTK